MSWRPWLKLAVLLLALLLFWWVFILAHVAHVTVVDDDGKPVPDATVTATWEEGLFWNAHFADEARPTASDGRCWLTLHGWESATRQIHAEKQGFYRQDLDRVQRNRLDTWLPTWDSFTIVLQRSRHPAPMLVNTSLTVIPAVGVPLGYDLLRGDWLPPFGHGTCTHLIITVSDRSAVDLQAANPGDGFRTFAIDWDSALHTPHDAPQDGYDPHLTCGSSGPNRDRKSCVIRFHDGGATGPIVYGAMLAIEVGIGAPHHAESPTIRLNAFLNPDHSTNLEWNGNKASPPQPANPPDPSSP